jgi:hypothetical protein
MARIVLVHGIAQEQLSADLLEEEWIPALIGGVRNAGYGPIADQLKDAKNDIRMAFYGQLFLVQGRQGAPLQLSDLSPQEAALSEQLAVEWLEHGVSIDPSERYLLGSLGSPAGTQFQGGTSIKVRAVAAASKMRWFSKVGFGFAEKFVDKALTQVTRYLSDPQTRASAQKSVLDLIGPETRIVVGHSLGSVVAYEALHKTSHKIPLLLTMGSPLGLKTIVLQELDPQPPTYPPTVGRWVNVSSGDDIVAAEPDLAELFGEVPHGSVFECFTVDNGASPHSGKFYLGKSAVGRPIGDVLSVTPSPSGTV